MRAEIHHFFQRSPLGVLPLLEAALEVPGMTDDLLDEIRQEYFDQKYVESFQVGQRIRSYDFPFNRDAYCEGIIREIGPWDHCGCSDPHLHIEVILDTLPEVARLQGFHSEGVVFQVEGSMLDPDAETIPPEEIEARDWVFPVIPLGGSPGMLEMRREMLEVIE